MRSPYVFTLLLLCSCGGRPGSEGEAAYLGSEPAALAAVASQPLPEALALPCRWPMRADRAPQPAGTEVRAERMVMSGEAGPSQALRCVIRSPAEWQAFREHAWESGFLGGQVYGSVDVEPDWDSRMVLVAAMGVHSTYSHSVGITRVEQAGDTLFVQVRSTYPTSGFDADMAVAPVHIVSVPMHRGPVVFLESAAATVWRRESR